ncbi:uncharacterized protein JCM15063_002987 [Sporobolomyces koalae]|uniref:uncharacterized protein n=1 Tax=Sporobolomyces koalae TaxID=500713 RepID=UPI00317B3A41
MNEDRASSIEVPVPRQTLPKPVTVRPVDRSTLTLDDCLTDVPTEFIRDVLRDLAPRILSGINCTSLDATCVPAPSKTLPTHARCVFDPALSSGAMPIPPTFLLAITFPAPNSSPLPPTNLLVPAHSLLYALSSPLYPLSVTQPPPPGDEPTAPLACDSATSLLLPIVGPIELPSVHAFSILHTYIHTRSSIGLQRSLETPVHSTSRLPSPPPSPKLVPADTRESSRPDRGGATSTSLSSRPEYDQEDEASRQEEARQVTVDLLIKAQDVWRTAVTLELSDPDLWTIMRSSWARLSARLP